MPFVIQTRQEPFRWVVREGAGRSKKFVLRGDDAAATRWVHKEVAQEVLDRHQEGWPLLHVVELPESAALPAIVLDEVKVGKLTVFFGTIRYERADLDVHLAALYVQDWKARAPNVIELRMVGGACYQLYVATEDFRVAYEDALYAYAEVTRRKR